MKTDNKAQMQQWRVAFSYLTNIGGSMRRVKGSTRWFDSLEEARASHWLKEDDSKIVTRLIEVEGPRP